MASPAGQTTTAPTAPPPDAIELGVLSIGDNPGESRDYDEPLPPKYDDIAYPPPAYDAVIAADGEGSISEHGGSRSVPTSPTSQLPPGGHPDLVVSAGPRTSTEGRAEVPQCPEHTEACHARSRAGIKRLSKRHVILLSLLVVLLLAIVVGVPLGLLLGKDSDTDGQGKN